MDADGQNETQLTDTEQNEFGAAFSPNGQRIAFNRLGNDERIGVLVMRDDGSVRVQKTFGRMDFFLDWQPV
jgi:Tol biopolymer transport system component